MDWVSEWSTGPDQQGSSSSLSWLDLNWVRLFKDRPLRWMLMQPSSLPPSLPWSLLVLILSTAASSSCPECIKAIQVHIGLEKRGAKGGSHKKNSCTSSCYQGIASSCFLFVSFSWLVDLCWFFLISFFRPRSVSKKQLESVRLQRTHQVISFLTYPLTSPSCALYNCRLGLLFWAFYKQTIY